MGGVWSSSDSGAYDPPEVHLTDVENASVSEHNRKITVCLMSRVDEHGKLVLVMNPKLANANPFHELLSDISEHTDDRLVIRYVELIHTHSDHVLEEFHFEIRNPFDPVDTDTQEVRDKVDEAWAPNDPKNGWREALNKANEVPSSSSSPKDKQEVDKLDEAVERLASIGEGRKAPLPPPSDPRDSPPPVREDVLPVSQWTLHRNIVERTNVMCIGPIEPGTRCKRVPVYKASISAHTVKWFAGQEHHIMNNRSQIIGDVDTRDMRRSPVRITQWVIYARDHSLLSFIREFAQELEVTEDDYSFVKDDRTRLDEKFVKVKLDLIQRAQNMIKEVVFAQIYYTKLSQCRLVHVPPSSDADQKNVIDRMARNWDLTAEQDWERGAYRPTIVLTFEVSYYVVSGVKQSAAAIHKEVTKIKTKRK
jgi:hypothetical protein